MPIMLYGAEVSLSESQYPQSFYDRSSLENRAVGELHRPFFGLLPTAVVKLSIGRNHEIYSQKSSQASHFRCQGFRPVTLRLSHAPTECPLY
jgi:hypothetical protein